MNHDARRDYSHYWPTPREIRAVNLQKKQEWLQSISKSKKGRK